MQEDDRGCPLSPACQMTKQHLLYTQPSLTMIKTMPTARIFDIRALRLKFNAVPSNDIVCDNYRITRSVCAPFACTLQVLDGSLHA